MNPLIDFFYQILSVDRITLNVVVVISVIAAVALREILDGATIHALVFFPGFVLGGLAATALCQQFGFFPSTHMAVNALIFATIGVTVSLLLMFALKRLLIYLNDMLHRTV